MQIDNKQDWKEKTFDLKRLTEFLPKEKVQLGATVEIIDVQRIPTSPNRPRFTGKFDFGEYQFDLPTNELRKLMEKYPIPKDWEGRRLKIKSYPYVKGGRNKGLTIRIEDIN